MTLCSYSAPFQLFPPQVISFSIFRHGIKKTAPQRELPGQDSKWALLQRYSLTVICAEDQATSTVPGQRHHLWPGSLHHNLITAAGQLSSPSQGDSAKTSITSCPFSWSLLITSGSLWAGPAGDFNLSIYSSTLGPATLASLLGF